MLSIIVAIANDNVIGKDNKLIWHIPEDLKRFKRITTGKTMIMGRKTFDSLGRVLPNRKHIVLCRSDEEFQVDNENVVRVSSVDDLKEYIDSSEENFVIGGASIYKLLLDLSDKLYITKIDQDFEGDTFFPLIDENIWEIIQEEPGIKNEENPFDYKYITYVRKK